MNSKKLYVCIISKYPFPHDTRLRQQAEVLRRNGVATDVVCQRYAGQLKIERFGQLTIYRVARPFPKHTFLLYIASSLRFAFFAGWRIFMLSLHHCHSIVVSHTLPEFLVFTATISKLLGKFVILDARDLSYELLNSRWTGSQTWSQAIRPFFRAMEYVCCRFSDRIITASNGFRERLIKRSVPCNKIITIVNSADDSIFKFHEHRRYRKITKGAKIIYHGTVAERFGVLAAIKAIHLLQRRIPNSQLHIYGGYLPVYRRQIDQTVDELNLSKSVFLHGYRSLEWLYEAMKSVDIGVVPYLSDEFMNLALSTKAFEYAAAGVPIVASRLDSLRLVFPDSCVTYVEPGNHIDLAEKIADLCLAASKRREQVRKARDAYEKVSGQLGARRFLSLVASLVSDNDSSVSPMPERSSHDDLQ